MTIDYLAHLRSESARFADVLADVDPATAVPTCPDWTVADLLHHLAEVQSFWAGILRDRPADEPDNPGPERPDDIGELRQLQRDATDALVAALDGADDTDPVWTWYDQDRSVGFIRRRQAHEALVHRWDAEIAAGVDQRPVEPELAADGVSEALGVMFGGCPEWATPPSTARSAYCAVRTPVTSGGCESAGSTASVPNRGRSSPTSRRWNC